MHLPEVTPPNFYFYLGRLMSEKWSALSSGLRDSRVLRPRLAKRWGMGSADATPKTLELQVRRTLNRALMYLRTDSSTFRLRTTGTTKGTRRARHRSLSVIGSSHQWYGWGLPVDYSRLGMESEREMMNMNPLEKQ